MIRMLLMAWLALGLGGCSKLATATRPATEAVGKVLLSPEDEKRLGDELAAEVEKQQKPVQDQATQDYLGKVGKLLLDQLTKDERRFDYSFVVLETPKTVNAFALPGGHIYVNSGLIRAAASEAELAAVLAHEIAHVVADHPSQQLAAQVGLATMLQLALGKDPAMVSKLAGQIAAQGYLAANSRESESEADKLGLRYLAAAGYEAQAMPAFFDKVAGMSGGTPNPVEAFFATHPDPGERSKELKASIADQGLSAGSDSRVGGFPQVQERLGGKLEPGKGAEGG